MPFLTETFTDSEDTLVTAHTPELGAAWLNTGFGVGAKIQLGRARAVSAAASLMYNNAVAPARSTGYSLYGVIRWGGPPGGSGCGPLACYDPASGTGYIIVLNEQPRWIIYLLNAGNAVGSATVSPLQTYTAGQEFYFELRIAAGSLGVYVNGATTPIVSSTDTAYSGTKAGLWNALSYDGQDVGQVLDWISDSPRLHVMPGAVTNVTPSGVTITAGPLYGGTGVTPQYELHRGNTNTFVPNGATTRVAGPQAAAVLVDAAPLAGDAFYRVVATDSVYTAIASDVLSSAPPSGPPLSIGFAGDSITAGYSWNHAAQSYGNITPAGPANAAAQLSSLLVPYRAVSAINAGVSGSRTNDWQPGGTNYNNSLTAFGPPSATPLIHLLLGANDAASANSVGVYASQLQSVVAGYVTAGYQVVVSKPLYYDRQGFIRVQNNGANGYGNAATLPLLMAYGPAIDTMVAGFAASNPGKVFTGDASGAQFFARRPDLLSDGLHPTLAGYAALGTLWAKAIANALTPGGTTLLLLTPPLPETPMIRYIGDTSPILFQHRLSSDHMSPATGLTLSVVISKRGGAFAPVGGVLAEVGSGWYDYTPTAGDVVAGGEIVFRSTAPGTDPATFSRVLVPAPSTLSAQNVADAALLAPTGTSVAGVPPAGAAGSSQAELVALASGETGIPALTVTAIKGDTRLRKIFGRMGNRILSVTRPAAGTAGTVVTQFGDPDNLASTVPLVTDSTVVDALGNVLSGTEA